MDEWTARRLLATAVLSRIWPSPSEAHSPLAQQLDGLGTDSLVKTLQPVTVGQDEARARQLLALLADSGQFPDSAQWDGLLGVAVQRNLVPPPVAGLSVSPCFWTVLPDTPAGGPAIAFETHHRVLGATPADFDALLDPSNWTACSPPWCGMDQVGVDPGDQTEFFEILSGSCPPSSPLTLETPLEFLKCALPDGTGHSLQYRLPPDPLAAHGDGVVSVDEGSIVVREWQGAVHLTTTKRIQFTELKGMPPVAAAWIAQLVWSLGYHLLAEYFVNRVVLQKQAVVTTSTVPGPAAGRSSRREPHRSGAATSRRLTECIDGLESSWTKVRGGEYGTQAYLSDLWTLADHFADYGTDLLRVWSGVGAGAGPAPGGGDRTVRGSSTCVSETIDIAPQGGVRANQTRALAMESPSLKPGLGRSGSDNIPSDVVRFEPRVLGPGQTSFRMAIDRKHLRGQPGGTYVGTVRAQVDGDQSGDTADVWIVVP